MKIPKIPYHSVGKSLLILNAIVAILYFSWWLDWSHASNQWLYLLLFIGEIYHVFMSISFWYTIWPSSKNMAVKASYRFNPLVDVFITVAGEPAEVVRKTIEAAKGMKYDNFSIYILNDGFVAKKSNWKEIEALANELGVRCITRKIPGGNKAGNINHALRYTFGKLVAIFDADMAPHCDFLNKTVFYFGDVKTGFVQTPQYYSNYSENIVTQGSWDQQKFFFGPVLRGKDKSNASFICGTNVLIRREALEAVGGMVENNIAEDFLTSLMVHQRGWKSYYVPQVLSEGLAPQDLQSYYKQQFRWARGSLEVLFGQNPVFKKGLGFGQVIQYLSSALYYFNGVIVLIDIIMPLMYLFTGLQPVAVSTASFAIYFLPFMFLNLYTLNLASGSDISFNTFSFSYSLWFLQLTALISVITKRAVKFSVTPKQAQSGNFAKLAAPHLVYIFLSIIGWFVAINRERLNPSVVTNMAWTVFNAMLFIPYILVAINAKQWLAKPGRVTATDLAIENNNV
jgi:cellulose synthase (UDP-forming)